MNYSQSNLDIDFLSFTRELFNEYSVLKIPSELEKNYNRIASNYGFDTIVASNIRATYNSLITKFYPNETTIKANFINNYLLKLKNNITFFEFNIDNSRADICSINGKSIAYEIKTDLDNFLRLTKQLYDYSKVFEEVYIICSKENLSNISKILPSNCGVYIYTISKDYTYTFKKIKNSESKFNLDSRKQLNLLTIPELITSFKKDFNYNTKQELTEFINNSYSTRFINSKFKQSIRTRYSEKWSFIKNNHNDILDLDYQWFFKNNISPKIIYQ